MSLVRKGLENNTLTSVALSVGTLTGAGGEEGELPIRVTRSMEHQRSMLGPAPFKIYRDTVAADIHAEDVTQRRRTANYPVPHRSSS